jgi:hypothetical protein
MAIGNLEYLKADRPMFIQIFSPLELRVMEELPKGLKSFPNDREYIMTAACAFDRNNSCFIRLCAAPICRTLSPICNLAPSMSHSESLIQMLAIALPCVAKPFALAGDIGRDIRLLRPVIIHSENGNRAPLPWPLTSFVNLEELKQKLEECPEAMQKGLAADESLADACDLVLEKV